MSASTRESHGAAPSSSVSCPHVTLSGQVQMGPTRTLTSDLLSATLAEAATQLSFAAFLERCIFVSASRRTRYQSPLHLWMSLRRLFHTPLPLGTFLRNSHSGSSWPSPSTHDVLCPTCVRPVPSLLLDAAVQTPLHNVATHDASTQLLRSRRSSSGASNPMTL